MASLYKFISQVEVIEPILRGIVKFTPIGELNDPSELVPNVMDENVATSLNRLRRDGYTDEDLEWLRKQGHLLRLLAPQFQAVDVPETSEKATRLIRSSFFDNITYLQERLKQTATEMSSKVGLLCLTERNDSLPMWAHYAANASGFVVEYNSLSDIFRGDRTGILCEAIRVKYDREHQSVTFDPRSHETLFFSKFKDWSYEQEVRIVVPLSTCRCSTVGAQKLYLREIARSSIVRVILGWRIEPEIRDRIVARFSSDYPQVRFAQASIENGCVRFRDI